MFALKKLLTSLVLPPGMFIVAFAVLGVCLLRKRPKAALTILSLTALMWLLSISPVSDMMLRGLESPFSIPEDPKGDAIVLLCGPVAAQSPDLTGMGIPSGDTLIRAVTAVRLQKVLDLPIIVSGGKGLRQDVSAASIVARILKDLNVLPDKIILEEQSRDTHENALYSAEICKKRGYETPILVTSAYHMRRALLCFSEVGLEVLPFPTGYHSHEARTYTWQAFLPGDYRKTALAMKEYLGLVFYALIY